MILRQHRFGFIQTADRDIDFFRKIVMLERQRCPARGAKASRGLTRRSEPRWLTGKDPETSFGHAEPGNEGSPARVAANRTVAIGFMKGQIVRLVANGPTKTPTLHHTRIPQKTLSGLDAALSGRMLTLAVTAAVISKNSELSAKPGLG